MEASIPEVDFQKLSSDEDELKKLREACEKCGCFRIMNHPIPLTLMADMKLVAKHLHDLPMDIKIRNKLAILPDNGYVSLSVTSSIYEGLAISDMHSSPHAIEDFCSELNVSGHHRQIIEAYGQAVHDLASSVSQKLSEVLGIKDTDYFKNWKSIIRTMKYNFTPEAMGSIGAELHSDTGFITLLHDDETVSGLELMDEHSSSFIAVPPKIGSFFCIIGDAGHVWSNGRFRNVRHRVVCKEAAARYSIGAFMSPRDGSIVEAPSKLVELDHAQLYRPFNFDELMKIKYEDLRGLKATTGKSARDALDQFRIG